MEALLEISRAGEDATPRSLHCRVKSGWGGHSRAFGDAPAPQQPFILPHCAECHRAGWVRMRREEPQHPEVETAPGLALQSERRAWRRADCVVIKKKHCTRCWYITCSNSAVEQQGTNKTRCCTLAEAGGIASPLEKQSICLPATASTQPQAMRGPQGPPRQGGRWLGAHGLPGFYRRWSSREPHRVFGMQALSQLLGSRASFCFYFP